MKIKSFLLYGACFFLVVGAIAQKDLYILLQDKLPTKETDTEISSDVIDKNNAQKKQEKAQTYTFRVHVPIRERIKELVEKFKERRKRRSHKTTINAQDYENLEEDLLTCIAYVENFSDTAYFCGARWTIGYGTTAYPNGQRVRQGDRISKADAIECVKYHLRRYVFPAVEKSVTRNLSQNEMVATCMFIYNVGGGNFSNRKGNGPCAFLKAINNNKSAEECAKTMTEYRYSAGVLANGLLKRRWLEGAIFCGHITTNDILTFSPAGVYNIRNLNDYLASYDTYQGLYSFNFDNNTIQKFRKCNRGRKSVKDII